MQACTVRTVLLDQRCAHNDAHQLRDLRQLGVAIKLYDIVTGRRASRVSVLNPAFRGRRQRWPREDRPNFQLRLLL